VLHAQRYILLAVCWFICLSGKGFETDEPIFTGFWQVLHYIYKGETENYRWIDYCSPGRSQVIHLAYHKRIVFKLYMGTYAVIFFKRAKLNVIFYETRAYYTFDFLSVCLFVRLSGKGFETKFTWVDGVFTVIVLPAGK